MAGAAVGNAPQGESEKLKDTGIMMSRNGPVITASGLVFIATKDEGKLRAYDEENGKVLWETDLPAASGSCPGGVRDRWARIYRSLRRLSETDGCAEGWSRTETAQPVHRSYIAFALPKDN